jgi:hypothetical protein
LLLPGTPNYGLLETIGAALPHMQKLYPSKRRKLVGACQGEQLARRVAFSLSYIKIFGQLGLASLRAND